MSSEDTTLTLRARDFWGAVALICGSVFFLWRTLDIPLFGGNRAGVSGADWYNSAAIVPLGIFSALLVLSVILLVISIRSGGATVALSAVGIGWDGAEVLRFGCIGLMMLAYIAGLVPRVDFILSSGLLISALIFGAWGGHQWRLVFGAVMVALPGLYAVVMHLPQAEWSAHDDDWVTLGFWGVTTFVILFHARADRVCRVIPVVALLAPAILVCAMAFGFRQNVPARTGLVFKVIEYHYYVTLRPIWRG